MQVETLTKRARRLGREGVNAAGIKRNTKRVDSVSGTANYRIPDEIGDTWIKEVKNVGEPSFDAQIRHSLYYTIMEGKQLIWWCGGRPTFRTSSEAGRAGLDQAGVLAMKEKKGRKTAG